MKCSQEGLALIKKFEGCRLKAYRCSANVLTIGYGHTGGVKEDDTITQPEADKLLENDIAKFEDLILILLDQYIGTQFWQYIANILPNIQ